MIQFLINRPVSVFAFFLGLLMLGITAGWNIPVSMLPEIDIPTVSIQADVPNISARELENTVIRTLRKHLQQTPYLKSIQSETRNGAGLVELQFDYGTNMDFIFLDVNEKIDRALGDLPTRIDRPKVIRASLTDVPVMNLSVFYKDSIQQQNNNSHLMLSKFAKNVLRGRLEQLSQIALLDMTGLEGEEIRIELDPVKIRSLGLQPERIEELIVNNNIELGNISVRDGFYEYDVKLPLGLKSSEDLENLMLNTEDKVLPLREFATIKYGVTNPEGKYLFNGIPAINIGVIKRQNAQLGKLKKELFAEIESIKKAYPNLAFEISQDQTNLLETTISNLKQSIYLGILVASLIVLLFFRRIKPALIITFVIPVSLLISLQLMYVFNIPISIISLAGLILSVGLIIDNSIIIIENIYQYFEEGAPIKEACISGTNEVIVPLLSSTLTTCSVFVPLIFLSGITGALFWDQVAAIFICLSSSLVVSITLLPVVFYMLNKRLQIGKGLNKQGVVMSWYKSILNAHFKFRYLFLLMGFLLLAANFFLFQKLDIRSFPELTRKEFKLKLSWNENITLEESEHRMRSILAAMNSEFDQVNLFLGNQQFLLNQNYRLAKNELIAGLRVPHSDILKEAQRKLLSLLKERYPLTTLSIEENESLFDVVFPSSGNYSRLGLQNVATEQGLDTKKMQETINLIQAKFPQAKIEDAAKERFVNMILDKDQLVRYDIDHTSLLKYLQMKLDANLVSSLKNTNELIPIYLSFSQKGMLQPLQYLSVSNREGKFYPLNEIIEFQIEEGYQSIYGNQMGEFSCLEVDKAHAKKIQNWLSRNYSDQMNVFFINEGINMKRLSKELFFVLLVAILLLYFILAMQFGSFFQPLIILLEIPIDIFGAILLLYLFGGSLNLMSVTGIIVMSGIIINDSILKIDKINKFRVEGQPLKTAILLGGQRRLRPILMTTLTTIAALIPFFWTSGLGSELQAPLALSIIGGLTLGTYISLFYLPLILQLKSDLAGWFR